MSLVQRNDAPRNSAPKAVGELDGHHYYNVSYCSVPRQELQPNDTDYARERDRAINHNSKDGVNPMTKEEQDFEREINWQVIKKFTMAIFSMDVTKFSFPVGYSEPRTFIERASDLFSFLTTSFMDKVVNEQDPQKRFALLNAGLIAPFYIYLQVKKPWNPVLGETYIGRWPNGTTIYGEQTSHHPPVSNIQIRPPDNSWKVDSQFNFEIDQGVFQIDILQKGRTTLTLSDGTVYEWEFPTISVTGILHGDRVVKVKGPFEVFDLTHNLSSHIKISPKKNKKIKELKDPKVTTIYGGILRGKYSDKNKTFLTVIHGDYTDKLYFDGEEIWDIQKDFTCRPLEVLPQDELLPSDCRFRLDRYKLITSDLDTADKAKLIVEELQRRDSKLRQANKKEKREKSTVKEPQKKSEKAKKRKDRDSKLQQDLEKVDFEIPAQ